MKMILSAKTKRAKKFETFLRYISEDIKSGNAGFSPERIYLQMAIDMNMILGDMRSHEYDKIMNMIKSARAPRGMLWPTTRMVYQLNNNSISGGGDPATTAIRHAFMATVDAGLNDFDSVRRNRLLRKLEESMLNLYDYAGSVGVDMDEHLPSIKLSIAYETDVDFVGIDPRSK